MNPILKLWMFENWIEDRKDDIEVIKNHAYLVGSFYNPEAAKKLIDAENGDGGTFKSSDEDFERSMEMVAESRKSEEIKKEKPKTKISKKKRKIKS